VIIRLFRGTGMNRQTQHVRRVVLTFLVVLAAASRPARAQYAGGSGTADDPYLIETAEQLNAIGLHADDWDKHFRLTADIDMNDLAGAKVNLITNFKGVFDGNDHTIANLTYLAKDEDGPPGLPYVWGIGLFRAIMGTDALVQNLGLINPDVRPDPTCTKEVRSVGALAGMLAQGWVRNCHVEGGRVVGSSHVGGLVGECSYSAAVWQSWSDTEVSGDSVVGGLIGDCHRPSDIWRCHARARVSGRANIGGLVGGSARESTIEDCFTTGTVTAQLQGGGLAGSVSGSVSHCYSTARVSGNATLGGLAGINWGLIRTSWAGGDVAGVSTVGGLVGLCMIGDGYYVPYFDTTVADSYATGAVRGERVVAGLVAHNYGTVLRCYAAGAVTASKANAVVGGLVAVDQFNPAWDVRSCFWDTTTSGVLVSDGGTGIPTAAMQDPATYTAAGWDFAGEIANGTDDLWKMSEDVPTYPKLAWEEPPAPGPAIPNGVNPGSSAPVGQLDQ
jgi:hypothetical protein